MEKIIERQNKIFVELSSIKTNYTYLIKNLKSNSTELNKSSSKKNNLIFDIENLIIDINLKDKYINNKYEQIESNYSLNKSKSSSTVKKDLLSDILKTFNQLENN